MDNAVRRTLVDITAFLNDESISFAVIGGIAVMFRGEPRFTADVDIVVAIGIDRALALIDAAGNSPFLPLFPDAAEVVETSFILPLRHRRTRIKVDLAIGLSGFERQMVARSENVAVGELSIPVATAEDLILMKVLAGRPRDVEDARGIVSRQAENLDWDHLLRTGGELQEAVSQDIVSQLRHLR